MDKEERRIQVNNLGNMTEEGRLKIKRIEEFQNDSDSYKANYTIFGMLGAVEILVGLIGQKMTLRDLSLLAPVTLVPLIALVYKKMRTDKKIYKLEEEILKQKTR